MLFYHCFQSLTIYFPQERKRLSGNVFSSRAEREFQSVPRYTKALLTCHFDSLYSDTKFHSLQGQTYTCNKWPDSCAFGLWKV